MNPPRLAHAFVFAVDVERMVAFYEHAFGMRREASSDTGFVIMRAVAGGADVAVHGLPPHIAVQIRISSPPQWRDDTAYKICFETDDLVRQRRAIVDHGGQAREPWAWEGTSFCECTDPEGNVVQIFQRPRAQ